MTSLFPFIADGGAVNWMALLVLASLFLIAKVPPLKRLAGI